MKNIKKFTLGIAMFLSAGTAALAQGWSDAWYIAPSANWLNPDSGFGVNKKEGGGGLRFGKAISPNADIQLGPTYARVNDNGVRYQQYLAGADALYLFSRANFRPFLLGGFGVEWDKKDVPGVNTSKTSPYINAGLGFQYAFNNQFALQADYRRVFGLLNSNDFGFKRPKNDYLTVGLNISFGSH